MKGDVGMASMRVGVAVMRDTITFLFIIFKIKIHLISNLSLIQLNKTLTLFHQIKNVSKRKTHGVKSRYYGSGYVL